MEEKVVKIIAKKIVNSRVVAESELRKQDLQKLLEAVKSYYYNDNVVSSKLCQYLPDTTEIHVYEKVNNTKDIPAIYCFLSNNDTPQEILVRENHKIMWEMINEWFR